MVIDLPDAAGQVTNSYSPECIIALHLQKNNPLLVYDLHSGRFLDYNANLGIYVYLSVHELRALIYQLITSNPNFLTRVTTKESFLGQVIKHLHILLGKNIEICPDVVFLNGRLNLKSGQLLEKTSTVYCTNYKPINYFSEEKLSPTTQTFLTDLTNRNPVALHCLRIWLRNALHFDSSDQFALYLVGLGSTGKSTFSNILVSIFGNNVLNVSLEDIDGKFNKIKLARASLCIIPDINYKGMTPSKGSFMKSVISGDQINGEEKFENPVIFSCKCNFLIHGNNALQINNSSELKTGLSRRFLYIYTGSAPLIINKNLNNELEDNLSGIINWANSTHPDYLSLIGSITSLNELLTPSLEDPLDLFIKTKVFENPGESILLGCTDSPPIGSLYYAYIQSLGLDSNFKIAPNRFPGRFEEKIKAKSILIARKRLNQGLAFVGISLSHGYPITTRKNALYDELKELNPFEHFSPKNLNCIGADKSVLALDQAVTNIDTVLLSSGFSLQDIINYKKQKGNGDDFTNINLEAVRQVVYDTSGIKQDSSLNKWNLPNDIRKSQGVGLTVWKMEFENRFIYQLLSLGLTPNLVHPFYDYCAKVNRVPNWTCFSLTPRRKF